jgi:diguanylate cyclase (GGDEF)-like protein
MNFKQRLESPHIKAKLRWDFIGMGFTALLAIVLIFLLDTGSLAQWLAKHKHTKIDEIIFASIALLIAFGAFSTRKWVSLSQLLVRYEESPQRARLPEMSRVRAAQQRDLFGVGLALIGSFIVVFFFDTGSLAEWIAQHKDTKIDEVIVTGIILLAGLLFFSIRRWLELTDQVVRYEELHRRTTKLNREITVLGELSESLQSCLSADEAHNLITATAQILFPESSGAVCITTSSRDMVEVAATWGDPALSERHFEPKDCWALRRGRLHRLGVEPTSLACVHLGSSRPAGSMCVPMMAHGEGLGLLYIDTRSSVDSMAAALSEEVFSPEERLARTLAEQSALALANLNMRDVLKMQSVRDPLTGLFNRRYMEESLDRELRRTVRKQSSLGILMIDIDHFKNLNDTFGHEAGDAVLRSLGTLLKGHFRGEDIVCRFGGEEFTVILPEASTSVARQRASELCEAVKQMLVQHRGQPLHSISLSIGVAVYGEQGTTADSLISAADSALYLAKKQGRDQVVVASPAGERKNAMPAARGSR